VLASLPLAWTLGLTETSNLVNSSFLFMACLLLLRSWRFFKLLLSCGNALRELSPSLNRLPEKVMSFVSLTLRPSTSVFPIPPKWETWHWLFMVQPSKVKVAHFSSVPATLLQAFIHRGHPHPPSRTLVIRCLTSTDHRLMKRLFFPLIQNPLFSLWLSLPDRR